MAANLTAVFELVDRISDKLDAISNRGSDAVDQWDRAESAADSAFGAAESGAQRAAQSVDGVASTTRDMGDSMDEASRAAESAADSMDYWTDAVGNYDKSALESIYTTEELVEMGFKTEDALQAEADAAEEATEALDDLDEQTQDTEDSQEDLGETGVDAISAINTALVDAGITKMLQEMAEAAYELATAFSEAESTVVIATGASGAALDSLTDSMMDAYAAAKSGDLSSVSAAVGEINTRMGLTGDELTEVTDLFVDFAAVTGGSASTSVRNVTQLMNQWNVGAEDLEATLDKLTYAGQVSGISVDTLSSELTSNKAILDQLGFSLDEAIAMFAQFELSGTSASSVMTGFRTALTSGTISSLEDLYEIFDQIASGEMSAADAADIFGTRASTQIVNAVNQGTLSLDTLVAALGETEGTTVKTAEAAQTLDQKWSQASNNISSAFTSALEPTISKASSGLATLANDVGTFLNEHPTVVKAITAVGVGVGVVAVGIAGVTFVTQVAIPAITAFGVALNTALGPIGWVALGITAVVAAGTALIAMLQDSESEYDSWTNTTKEQYDALQDLNAEYEEACATYGETSEEASRLKYQIDDLTESFEASKQTVEEFVAECDALVESSQNIISSYEEAMGSIQDSEVGTMALITKLEDLASANDTTAASETAMQAIIDELNEQLPDLALSYDDVTSGTTDWAEAMKAACEAQAEQQRLEEQRQTYVDLLQEQAKLEDQRAEAVANLNAEMERTGYYYDEMGRITNGTAYEGSLWTSWTTDINDYSDALAEIDAQMAENQAILDETEAAWEAQADAMNDTTETTITWQEAASTAFQAVEEDVTALIEAYSDAYDACYTSLTGQFGLFDEASMKSDEYMNSTVANAQAALDSQLAYWETYSANIDTLKSMSAEDLGVTQENYDLLMSYVQDGSEEAAGLAASMVQNIQNGNTEAVTELATTAGEVQAKQEEIAASVADWTTGFSEQMDEIVSTMENTIDDMNLDTEANEAATATIQAYADAILANKSSAVSAAQQVSAAVAAALKSTNTSGTNTSTGVAAHASGTTDAEDVFVAGENGPELVVGAAGSTVFPTDQTRRIINAVDNASDKATNIYLPGASYEENDTGSDSSDSNEKRVFLEIAGKGNIELTGGKVDDETLLAFLYEYLKPVLAEIVTQEIFEEGDSSYEY